MLCPICDNTELETQGVALIEIERCPQCRGLWLDANELEQLVASPPKTLLKEDRSAAADSKDNSRRLMCPRCRGTPLIKLNSLLRPGTIIDSCTVCHGAWLDAGELTRLTGQDLVGRIRQFFLGK